MTARTTDRFAEALRAAIKARGLGVDRLCERLRGKGVGVSAATLSYWQSGRSRPERPSSLASLTQLEDILGVPAGALSGLLGPPRRRRTWAGTGAVRAGIGAWWPEPGQVADVTGGVDTRWDERLTRISQHDRVTVGPERGERVTLSRQVLRAKAAGPDRWVAIVHVDEHDRAVPCVRPVRHCRLGRVVSRPRFGLVAAELIFDHRLARGETVITEHEVVNRSPYPLATNYERKFRLPVREFVLEIGFDPGTVPARCERFEQQTGLAEVVEPVEVADSAAVHAVTLNFGPGRFGFRWNWDT